MPTSVENEKLIREFLLGELPDGKRFEFEEKFIKDADLFEQIKSVEDELIEQYVRGWMNPAETAKFEKHFLATNKRRERVRFTNQFINKIQNLNAETVVVNETDESVWQKFAEFFLMPKIAIATAFAVLIAAFGSWFLYQNLNGGKPEIAKVANADISTSPEIIKTPTPEIPNDSDRNENVSEVPQVEKTPANTPKPTEPIIPKTPQTIKKTAPNPVLALFAGTLRSEGENNVLKLPKASKGAVLQLNLESVDYKIYQVEITDANGNLVFRKNNLKTKKERISLFVPNGKLKVGDYLIKLAGKNDSESESVADFQFRVSQ